MNEKKQVTDLRGIIINFLYHWPLFLIGLLIAFAGLFCYLKLSKPVYPVMASVKITDEKKSADRHSALKEIDLSSAATIIENEMAVLQSNRLMMQVVEDLQLWISVQQKNGFQYEDMYTDAPFVIDVIKTSPLAAEGTMQLQVKDASTFLLTGEDGVSRKYTFGKPFTIVQGTFALKLRNGKAPVKDQQLRIQFEDVSKRALYYQQAIEVTMPNKLANVIALSLKDPLPQRGKDILNKLIYNYQLSVRMAKREEAKRTLDFVNQRLELLSSGVSDAEKDVENFRISSGVTDIASESKIGLENKQANETRLNEVRVQLGVVEGIESFLKSSRNSDKIPATMGVIDPALNSLIEKLTDLQLQRQRLLATTPETNPDFEPINRQIASTYMALKENVRGIKASLLRTASSLRSFDSGIASTIKSLPTQERQLLNVKRQQASKDNLYNYLLQKKEEAELSYGATVEAVDIVDVAYTQPAKIPQKPLAVAVSLLLGLMLPVGVLYGRGALRPSLTDLQQMKTIFDIPVLAELPFEATKEKMLINGYQISPIIDHLRALRIKLGMLYGTKSRGRVTLITSSAPNEGKSFLSTNLGTSIAMSGRKTVIVEMDMRRPKIGEMLSLRDTHAGMSDFLTGSLRLADVVQTIGQETNLDVITCGKIVNHSSELLESPRLRLFMEQLLEIYDDVIIDSPPVHMVPDALILSKFADVTLYVVRQGVTGVEEVRFIKELYEQQQLKNMNLIFNGIMREKYGYGYSYGSDYAYSPSKKLSVFANISDRF